MNGFVFDLQRFDGEFSVNGTTYNTLKDAVDAVGTSGGTIKLNADYTTTESDADYTDTEYGDRKGTQISKNITLDLNGKTLTSSNASLFNVSEGAKLTITDSSYTDETSTKGKIVNAAASAGRCILLNAGANLEVSNVQFADAETAQNGIFFYLKPAYSSKGDSYSAANTTGDWVSKKPGEITLNNVDAETNSTTIFYSPENKDNLGDPQPFYISKYKFTATGGTYKANGQTGDGSFVIQLCGMNATLDSVTIDTYLAGCVYACARYDENYEEEAAAKANATFKDCNFTKHGIGQDPSSYKWCNTLIAVAAGNVAQIEGGTYTFEKETYGLYVFSSYGGFIIDDGTFNDNSDSHTLFQLDADLNSYGSKYSKIKTPASVNGGTFNIGEEATRFVSGSSGSKVLNVTGGRFSADISEYVANGNFAYENTDRIGTYYYVTSGGGWNPALSFRAVRPLALAMGM